MANGFYILSSFSHNIVTNLKLYLNTKYMKEKATRKKETI
jgi:hypothetical protein